MESFVPVETRTWIDVCRYGRGSTTITAEIGFVRESVMKYGPSRDLFDPTEWIAARAVTANGTPVKGGAVLSLRHRRVSRPDGGEWPFPRDVTAAAEAAARAYVAGPGGEDLRVLHTRIVVARRAAHWDLECSCVYTGDPSRSVGIEASEVRKTWPHARWSLWASLDDLVAAAMRNPTRDSADAIDRLVAGAPDDVHPSVWREGQCEIPLLRKLGSEAVKLVRARAAEVTR